MAASSKEELRLTFQEQMDLIPVPLPAGSNPASGDEAEVRRYMGKRAAWLPGLPGDLFSGVKIHGEDMPMKQLTAAAFGGQVYSQSALAVCRAWRDQEDRSGVKEKDRLGLHTIHGYFTAPGSTEKPFIYTVSTTTSSPTFSTLSVTARQPIGPSHSPTGDHYPPEDASLPVGPPCFHAVCSLKRDEPHSQGMSRQEDPPQKRYADILARRKPQDWPPSPPVDVDGVVKLVGTDLVGTFPIVDMKKVDMSEFNRGKPLHERRELLLYRLLAPLPSDGTDGWDANAHVLVHAYEADRNGLLMVGNHLGFGERFGRAASMSYSFVVHTGVRDAILRYEEQNDEGGGWWIQEACFPRAGSGRAVIMSKIWSPAGLHVATEYQDGLCKGRSVVEKL